MSNDGPVTEDARFVLGEISAVVKTLPARMDRFESTTNTSLQSLNDKIAALSVEQGRQKGIIWVVSGVIAAGISGIITKFWGH